jgi:putative acetyltransferase
MEVEIRRTEPADAKAVKEIYECKKAYSGTLQLPHPSLDLWEKRLASIPNGVYTYVAIINDEIVGNLGLHVCENPRRKHAATFGMGVKDHFQGKGVGSALLQTAIDLADNWLNLRRLELTVYTDNIAAIALYKKFGFVVEGESPEFAFRNGEYVAAYHMARVHPNTK